MFDIRLTTISVICVVIHGDRLCKGNVRCHDHNLDFVGHDSREYDCVWICIFDYVSHNQKRV